MWSHALTIGFIAGFGGGFVSLGGGTLAIPLLISWIGLNAFQARGTALMVALFSASMGSFVYHQGGLSTGIPLYLSRHLRWF